MASSVYFVFRVLNESSLASEMVSGKEILNDTSIYGRLHGLLNGIDNSSV